MVIGSMNDAIIMLAAICFPILFGAVILLMPEFSSRNRLLGAVGTGLLVTGILALLTLRCGEAGICLFSLGEKLEIVSKAYLSVFEAYSVEELTEMILDGTIMDAKTVSAILAYKAKYKK